MTNKKLHVWISSTGRFKFLKPTIDSFIKHNTYENFEFLIVESTPTEESKKIFYNNNIETDKCIEYIDALDCPKKIWIQPWKFLGNVFEQLLNETGDYFLSLEDDCVTVCDPRSQIEDGMLLLDNDPNLLALRMDLKDPTSVYSGSDRFKGTKKYLDMDYVYWDNYADGMQLVDARKLRNIDAFLKNRPLHEWNSVEPHISKKMIDNNFYCGVNCKYYGFLVHAGTHSVVGDDRSWSTNGYANHVNNQWFGNGPDRIK